MHSARGYLTVQYLISGWTPRGEFACSRRLCERLCLLVVVWATQCVLRRKRELLRNYNIIINWLKGSWLFRYIHVMSPQNYYSIMPALWCASLLCHACIRVMSYLWQWLKLFLSYKCFWTQTLGCDLSLHVLCFIDSAGQCCREH